MLKVVEQFWENIFEGRQLWFCSRLQGLGDGRALELGAWSSNFEGYSALRAVASGTDRDWRAWHVLGSVMLFILRSKLLVREAKNGCKHVTTAGRWRGPVWENNYLRNDNLNNALYAGFSDLQQHTSSKAFAAHEYCCMCRLFVAAEKTTNWCYVQSLKLHGFSGCCNVTRVSTEAFNNVPCDSADNVVYRNVLTKYDRSSMQRPKHRSEALMRMLWRCFLSVMIRCRTRFGDALYRKCVPTVWRARTRCGTGRGLWLCWKVDGRAGGSLILSAAEWDTSPG